MNPPLHIEIDSRPIEAAVAELHKALEGELPVELRTKVNGLAMQLAVDPKVGINVEMVGPRKAISHPSQRVLDVLNDLRAYRSGGGVA